MWYDKATKMFHLEDRDVEDVVAKLRFVATKIEQGTFGALTLNALGDIFGNEFWNLIYVDRGDVLSDPFGKPSNAPLDLVAEVRRYLDAQVITGETIGGLRRSCFVPWPSRWNAIVREETAKRERSDRGA